MSESITEKFFKVIATSDVFGGGKTLIPKKIRNKLKIKDGNTLVWIQMGDKIFMDTAIRETFFAPIWPKIPTKKD